MIQILALMEPTNPTQVKSSQDKTRQDKAH
jgi:hypothetical protein